MTQNGNLLVFIPARNLNLIEINYYLSRKNSQKQIALTRSWKGKTGGILLEWFKVEMSISTQEQNIIISWSQTVNISTCRFETAIDSASLSTKMSIFSCL